MSGVIQFGKYQVTRFELSNISYGYSADSIVFRNVSLDMPLNEIRHVTGPSGHGQSTLLKLLALLNPPFSGEIRVNGKVVSEMSFEEFLPWRIEIGYTFEGGGLLANRTLRENLALPHLYHNLSSREQIEKEINEIAERFHFLNYLDRRPGAVSGGLRKLLTILRPVLLKPSLLLMEDPFAGLDQKMARELVSLIKELRSKEEIQTVYFTSRDEVWPKWLDAKKIWTEGGEISLENQTKSAAG